MCFMRTPLYPLALVGVLILASCQKELSFESTIHNENEGTETKYLTLGTWDSWGRPNYIVGTDVISSDLKYFLSNTFPAGSDLTLSHPELLSVTAKADIALIKSSDVFITYVQNGAGITNTIAFYTYPTSTPPLKTTDIKTITYVFPNAGSGSTLDGGDKVKIGKFDAGTSIGFVLLQDGWNSTTGDLDNTGVHFYSTDLLNPEPDPSLKKHVISVQYAAEHKLLIGFEDVDRTRSDCDHDFNDVMFYVTIIP